MKLRGDITARTLGGGLTEWSWDGGPIVTIDEAFLVQNNLTNRRRIQIGPYRLRWLDDDWNWYRSEWVPDTLLGALIVGYWRYRTWARRIEHHLFFAAFRLGWLDHELNRPASWSELKILKRLAPRG